MTWAENQALLQGLAGNPAVAGSSTWNIPLWITLVRDDNGNSYQNDAFFPQQMVAEASQYFTNGLAFYVCGVTFVNETDWLVLDLTDAPGDPSEKTQLLNLVNTQNAQQYALGYINVNIVQAFEGAWAGHAGVAGLPSSAAAHGAINLTVLNSNILAHELGHYFGLAHTDAGGHFVQPPPSSTVGTVCE